MELCSHCESGGHCQLLVAKAEREKERDNLTAKTTSEEVKAELRQNYRTSVDMLYQKGKYYNCPDIHELQ